MAAFTDIEMIRGLRVATVGESDGAPPWVLLHGLGNSLEYWLPCAKVLAQSRQVVALDIPGFGHSVSPGGPYTMAAVVDAILGVLKEELTLSSWVLGGHSMGAVVAASLVDREHGKAHGLALVSGSLDTAVRLLGGDVSTAVRRPAAAASLLAQFVGGAIGAPAPLRRLLYSSSLARKALLWPFVARPAELTKRDLGPLLRNAGSAVVPSIVALKPRVPPSSLYADLGVPLLVIDGAEDPLVTANDHLRTKQIAVTWHAERLAGVGHWPMIEQPSAVAERMAAFAASVVPED